MHPRHNEDDLAVSLASRSLALTVANVVEAATSLVGSAVLLRAVSPAVAGRMFIALSAMGVVGMVLDLRLGDSYTYFAPRWGSGDSSLLKRLLRIEFFKEPVLVAVGFALAAILGQSRSDSLLFMLCIVGVAAGGPVAILSAHLLLIDRWKALAISRCAATVFGLLVQLLLIPHWGTEGYLVGAGAAVVVLMAALGWLSRGGGTPDERGTEGSPIRDRRAFVRFTGMAALTTTVAAAGERVGPLVVGSVGGPAMAAQFRVATSLGRLLATLMSSVAGVLFPQLSRLSSTADYEGIRVLALRSTRVLGSLSLLGALVAAPFVGRVVALLYGGEYAGLGVGSAVFLGAYAVRQATPWAKVLALAIGRPGVRLTAQTAESVVLLAATLMLARVGLTAVALGTLAIWSAVAFSWLFFVSQLDRSMLDHSGPRKQRPASP